MTNVASYSETGSHEILQACLKGYIPANADVEAAIEAHRLAFEQFIETKDESDRPLAAYAIRAVIYASPKTRAQAQQTVDYLTALPIEAWEGVTSGEPVSIRESTLAMCAWWLTRMVDA
jgi:hypothetical protein